MSRSTVPFHRSSLQYRLAVPAALIALVAGLAACGKFSPEARKETPAAPSTSADPKKAEEENKRILADAEKKKKEAEAAAAAAKKDGKDSTAADEAAKEAERIANLIKNPPTDAKADVADGATVAPVVPGAEQEQHGPPKSAAVPSLDSKDAQPKVADAAAPAQADSSGSKTDAPAVAADAPALAAPADTAQAAPAAPADGSVDLMVQLTPPIVKINLINTAMEINMRFNYQVAIARYAVEQIAKKEAAKQELTQADKDALAKAKADYGLKDEATTAEVLERVDVVALPVVLAPIAFSTGWGTKKEVTEQMIATAMKKFNVEEGEGMKRFRAKRAEQRASGKVDLNNDKFALLEAFLGDMKQPQNEAVMQAAKETIRLMGSHPMIAARHKELMGKLKSGELMKAAQTEDQSVKEDAAAKAE